MNGSQMEVEKMARVTLKDIEQQLQIQNEICERTKETLAALGPETCVRLGESFLEDLLAIDERVEAKPSFVPTRSYLRI